MTKLKSKIDIS